MLQILKTKQKEIAMKKRKSYAEFEPVKKNHSVWRGFVIITIMLKTKRKTEKTYKSCFTCFQKKKKSKGRARLHTPISENVVGENGEWQLSNGNCTTERNCSGFHKFAYLTMKNSIFAGFVRAFFIF